jgi:hypothetical protein
VLITVSVVITGAVVPPVAPLSAASVAEPTSVSVPHELVSAPPPAPPAIAVSAEANALGQKMYA